jgi:hypothetical protein
MDKLNCRFITQKELADVINRIMDEEKTQSEFNGEVYKGLTATEICNRVRERIGGDWGIVSEDK